MAYRCDDQILRELRQVLPGERLITDWDVVTSYARDDAEWAPCGTPQVVVRPRTAEEVRDVVRSCRATQTPIVTRGAGTGQSGGANAIDGCVMLVFEQMAAIQEVNQLERLAVVEPGVINEHLRSHCAEYGLWYPPDPSSATLSTVGGNVSTNAGGLCCVKYGVTRDYVLGLQVVTGTGELVRLGHRTAKGVAGYDLCGLMVGSEGTLGIITEATVRLRALPGPERTIAGYFDSLYDAGRAVAAVASAGLTPAMLELIDKTCLQAVDSWKNMGLSAEAEVVLVGRTDSPGAAGEQESATMLKCFQNEGATWAVQTSDPEESEGLFQARRLAYPAMARLGPVLTEDVCVPKAAVPEMLTRVQQVGASYNTTIANIAHAGDGNLHPLLITPANDEKARERAESAFEEILSDAIELGGTITGEHGVGLLKRDGLCQELSQPVMAMQHAVKNALDPNEILNPGKVV